MEMIYFDHNATAPYSPSVREYLQTSLLEDWQNPSSVYPQAQILDQRIKECKSFVAERLNCSPKHLFWTSGGTESINTVLSPETLKLNGLSGFISSRLEHHASLRRLEYLSQTMPLGFEKSGPAAERKPPWPPLSGGKTALRETGKFQSSRCKIHYAPHNEQGEIDLSLLEEICSKNPRSLLSFLSANNETGVLTDIKSVSKIARQYDCLVHADAVQSLGKEPLDLEDWDADFASFSGHKIGAMKGVGLLFARKPFAPLMHGGGQERGMRPGTYNFPAVYSFKPAVQDIDLSKQREVRRLRDYFEERLKYSSPSGKGPNEKSPAGAAGKAKFFRVNCDKAPRLPNTSNIYCGTGISNQAVLLHLARKGICVSVGSACNAGSPEPSHVMARIAAVSENRKKERIFKEPFHAAAEADGSFAARPAADRTSADRIAADRIAADRTLSEARFGQAGPPDGVTAASFNDAGADYADSCLRISFAPSNTKAETDFLLRSLKEFYDRPQLSRLSVQL